MNRGTKGVSKICLLASFLFLYVPLKSAAFSPEAIIEQFLIKKGSDEVDKVFFCPKDGQTIQNIIIALIASAKKIHGALYLLSQKFIIDALIAAHKKGTEIQLIIDSGALSNGIHIMSLARAGIPLLLFDGTRFNPLMHNKFFVFKNVDRLGDVVVSGSMNFTQSGLFNNAENLTIRNKIEIVTQFAQQFRNLIQQCQQFSLSPVQSKRKRKRQQEEIEQRNSFDLPDAIAEQLATGKLARYVTVVQSRKKKR
jgi:phosphatidylserine/phosphatidylglycerophosphate/cardiolipin synthase-like enzyme